MPLEKSNYMLHGRSRSSGVVVLMVTLALTIAMVSSCEVSESDAPKTTVGLQIISSDLISHDPYSIVRGFCHSNATVTLYNTNETIVGNGSVGAGAFEVRGVAIADRYEATGDVLTSGMYECSTSIEGRAQNPGSVAIDNSIVVAYFYDSNDTFLCNSFDIIDVLGPGDTWDFRIDCWYGAAASYEFLFNTPPPFPTVLIMDTQGSTTVTTTGDLHCSAFPSTDEADNDTLSYAYQWYCNGVEVTGVNWIDSSRTSKGELWACQVHLYDGYEYSEYGSNTTTIANSLPTKPVIKIRPENPAENRSLICQVWGRSIDADNEVVTYRYRWYRGAATLPFRDVESTSTADVLNYQDTLDGQIWRCDVTTGDGEDWSQKVSDSCTIGPSIVANGDVNGDGLVDTLDISALEILISSGG